MSLRRLTLLSLLPLCLGAATRAAEPAPDLASVAPAPAAARPAAASRPAAQARRATPRRARSVAALSGLRETPDPLELTSSVALAVDQDSGETYYEKNADIALPIASVTKLMTALVIAESGLPSRAGLRVSRADYVSARAESQLREGMVITRGDALRAALVSSDNRAASLLARTYPGGTGAFVRAMNEKARALGLTRAVFADPTGLSDDNVASARDLALLVGAAYRHEAIRQASAAPEITVRAGAETIRLRTTNRLIGDPRWRVGLQKTGHTTAAGLCMVVQSEIAGRPVVLVALDAGSNAKRADDMRRLRDWLEGELEYDRAFARVAPWDLL